MAYQRLAFGLLKLGAERHHFDAQTQRGKKDFAKSGVIAPGQQNTVAFAQRPAAIKLRHRPLYPQMKIAVQIAPTLKRQRQGIRAAGGAVAQGLIWGLMAIGVYITFRILDVADLTVDGSLATGGAVAVMLIRAGLNAWAALLCAFLAGMLAGFVTGLFHTKCGIPAILAGILTQLSLYSINLRIMGSKANQAVGVDKYDLLVSQRYVRSVSLDNPLPLLLVFTVVLIAVLYWFFGTEKGCSLRATGANPNMARAQGINTNANVVLGLMVSNGLVALSGGLLAQFQGSSDINMGRGAIVIGLAAVIIGEVAFGKVFINFALKLLAVSIGAVIYYIVLQIVLQLGLNTNDLKLVSALIVAVFLAIPYWKGHIHTKKGGSVHA